MTPHAPTAKRTGEGGGWAAGSLAFTLIELLAVLAIIGILMAILIPSVSAARTSAKSARTKVMFAQWAVAMEQFKQEYGYYPKVDGASAHKIDTARFVAALTGKRIDGTSAEADELFGNNKRIVFYEVGDEQLDGSRQRLVDAFGNTDIAVLYDRDGDGVISLKDGTGVAVEGRAGKFTPDASELDLRGGLRATVIFYSAGKGDTQGDLVMSWR